MLRHLSIENYTLIEHLSIDFEGGFSVITGETGAGKSILLGALSLLLGQRAGSSILFDKTKKSVIEATFSIKEYDLEDFFIENDIDFDTTCIIRREITPQEKSRSFINDTPVNLSVLKRLGDILVDIHSQHSNLLLQNKDFQLIIIDQFANIQNEVAKFSESYKEYHRLKKTYQSLFESNAEQEKDYLEFLLDEFEKADIKAGEQAELESELEVLSHAEEIKKNLYAVYHCLAEKEENVVSLLHDCKSKIQSIEKYAEEIRSFTERINSQIIELKDVSDEIERFQAATVCDPLRMEFISSRLDEIYRLEQKHKVQNEEQLIEIKEEISEKLQKIQNSEQQKEEMKKRIKQMEETLFAWSVQLSKKRKEVLPLIEKKLEQMLHSMNMPTAKIQIQFEEENILTAVGINKATFFFTANLGAEMQPISKIASGGELSRLMLGVKSLISQKNILPTIIFDEIDSGVSGEVSAKMAKVMQQIAKYSQVIAISHLAQIASKGENHYLVFKQEKNQKTVSDIKKLTDKERVNEIAKMISDEKITDASILMAQKLLSEK